MEQHIYLTVDAIIFGHIQGDKHVLLIKRVNEPYKDIWAIPGGFVNDDEDLEAAAIRELYEETNIRITNLKQLYTVGTPHRDPRFRTAAVIYYTHTDPATHIIKSGDDAKDAQWWPIDKLPPLAFDHTQILADAIAAQ